MGERGPWAPMEAARGLHGKPCGRRGARRSPVALLLSCLLFLFACSEKEPEARFPRPVSFSDLPGWTTERHAEAIPPLLDGCRVVARMPPERSLGGTGPTALTAGELAPLCAEAASLPSGDDTAARAFLERRFRPLALGEGLLTGYFEPELQGTPRPEGRFTAPLLARPPELVEVDLGSFAPDLAGRRIAGQVQEGKLHPFPDRAAIAGGALAGRGLELAWVDPVEAFFLQIQGSGRVVFPDGQVRRFGYAGQNGHAYVPVGRVLIERGELTREEVSMQAVRDWMRRAGPQAAAELMARNPSYVFFAQRDGLSPEEGPLGTLGAPLTPGRSLAVDRTQLPLGLPVWFDARNGGDGLPLRRLAVAQDTGGAIRGAARGDLFQGWGEDAAERAGRMRDPAGFFVLLPREAAGTSTTALRQ